MALLCVRALGGLKGKVKTKTVNFVPINVTRFNMVAVISTN